MPLEQVISGGQTGADRAALSTAKAYGFATGGWMPRGFLALDGHHPEFAERFGMLETDRETYASRTALNVRGADATLRFATIWDSAGEVLTLEFCQRERKPWFDVTPGGDTGPVDVVEWLISSGVRVLNVAGNSEQTSPGIEEFVADFLGEVFRLLLLGEPH